MGGGEGGGIHPEGCKEERAARRAREPGTLGEATLKTAVRTCPRSGFHLSAPSPPAVTYSEALTTVLCEELPNPTPRAPLDAPS